MKLSSHSRKTRNKQGPWEQEEQTNFANCHQMLIQKGDSWTTFIPRTVYAFYTLFTVTGQNNWAFPDFQVEISQNNIPLSDCQGGKAKGTIAPFGSWAFIRRHITQWSPSNSHIRNFNGKMLQPKEVCNVTLRTPCQSYTDPCKAVQQSLIISVSNNVEWNLLSLQFLPLHMIHKDTYYTY